MSAPPQPYQGYATATTMMTTTSPQGYHQPTSVEEVRTLWIGDLQYWVDESYLHSCFSHTGEVLSLSLSRSISLSGYICICICIYISVMYVSNSLCMQVKIIFIFRHPIDVQTFMSYYLINHFRDVGFLGFLLQV